ncbi:MAG: hypothetical protein RJB13_2494, partial [Pseudomonadota bacterium]
MKKSYVKWGALGLLGVAAVAASCSKKKTEELGDKTEELGDGAAIIISGQLAISNSANTLALSGAVLNATDVNPDDLNVYCVSFEVPPKAGTGDVDSSGNFS